MISHISRSSLVHQLKHMFSVFKEHYTYFHTCFQTTKYIFLSVYTEHPPNILGTHVVESIVWIG